MAVFLSSPAAATPLDRRLAQVWPAALVLLALLTMLIRARYFGNPLIDVDEEFYLLTGDRMLHGAIPYVDLWDRKPVGLFLLYAGIRLLGGVGIVQYQLVAALFAAATAVVIACLARRVAAPGPAWLAGLLYVPALAMSGGQGGQTPVFYNLLVALAAGVVLTVAAPRGATPDAAAIRRRGLAAMLLVGVALQIKYTALFEGLFLGLVLLWCAWRARPRPAPFLADAALWIAAALLPTALAWGWYAAHGLGDAFIYANFTSILHRESEASHEQLGDLRRILVRLTPWAVAIAAGLLGRGRREPVERPARLFLFGWLGAALVGFAAFGTFFNHYALPLLPPLAIAAAPGFARVRPWGGIVAALVTLALFIPYPLDARKYERRHGDAAYAQRLVAAIAPRLHGRCLYVFYGEPILYHLTGSCLPTAYAFPFHLSLRRESRALGVDPLAETRRILDTRPPVVVDRINTDEDVNRPVQAYVRARLRRDYRLVFTASRWTPHGTDTDQVWALPGT